MAWGHTQGAAFAYGGEADDKDISTGSNLVGVVAVSRQITRVQTGAGGLDFDLSVNANRAVVRVTNAGGSYNLIVYRGYFGLDVAPTSAMALLYGSTDTTGVSGGTKYCEIGTDRKIRFYTKTGAQVGGTSATLIPTAGLQEMTIVVDAVTLPTVWISLLFGATEELFFDTGLTRTEMFANEFMFCGEALAAGVNRGCHLYVDDLTSRPATGASAASDAPHLAQYPRLNIYGAVDATTIGNYAVWDSMTNNTVDNASSLASYVDNGELPTHDGDTSHLQSTTTTERFSLKSTVANPLPNPWTVAFVAPIAALRLTGSGKGAPEFFLRLAATDATIDSGGGVSASFSGAQTIAGTAPGGGAWVRANADASTLEWGFISNATDPGARVTCMPGPLWVGSNTSLSLTTPPESRLLSSPTLMGMSAAMV